MSTPTPSPYRGVHTSLYNSLPDEAIQHLEDAIWLKTIGQYNIARAIFEGPLQQFVDIPVVTIELADLEHESGRWGAGWRVLDSYLLNSRANGKDMDTAEHRLIALIRAMLGTRHRGDIESAVVEMERTQQWLHLHPIENYTDIHVSCIRRYVIVCLFVRLYSGIHDPATELIPLQDEKDGPATPWGGLHHLRRHICRKGMFNEANLLFRVEFNRTPPEHRQPVAQEFLSSLEMFPASLGRDLIEATVRLQWAETWVQLQQSARAEEEFTQSEAAFERFAEQFGITDRSSTRHMQALEYEKLCCIQDPIERLQKTEALAERFETSQSFKTDVCLSAAADLVLLFYRVTSEEEYLDKFFSFRMRLEKHIETFTEDIADLVMNRCSLISVVCSDRLADRQRYLEWTDGFLEHYKHFTSPQVLAPLYRSQSALLKSLRRLEEAERADEKAKELDSTGPFIGKWSHLPAPSASRDNGIPQDEEEEDIEEPFYWRWKFVVGDFVKLRDTAINTVWEWALDDVAAGTLAVPEFKKMMGFPDAKVFFLDGPEQAQEIRKLREHPELDDLASTLFTATDQPDPAQEARYEQICRWLGNPPKGHKNRRLFGLVMLRDARQQYLDKSHLKRCRIRELQHLVELHPTLPRIILETMTGLLGPWLSLLSSLHIALLENVSDFEDESSAKNLYKANQYHEQTLAEFRKAGGFYPIAGCQVTGSQICLLQILRLKHLQQLRTASVTSADADSFLSPDKAVEEIARLRDLGLDKIKEADAILSERELHASWNVGVEGVTQRQDLAQFHGTAYVGIMAIRLLLAGEDSPSDETASIVWDWVQKYKARSLARTIGARTSDSPELLSRIKSSVEAKPLYDELVALREQIEKSKLIARFELRGKLAAHEAAIKGKNALLRQLMDMREATPFQVSDIEAIEAQVGAPIVLIDWMYLGPYLTGNNETMLLLTIRAGSKPKLDFLTTKMDDIMTWQKRYLAPETWRKYREERLNTLEARETFDEMLGGLVEPLARRTRPEEVLVFCPSDTLHRLPLHALSVPEPDTENPEWFRYVGLIHRNPVVYTHSHSLLRSCFAATQAAGNSPDPLQPRFYSGIPQELVCYEDETGQKYDYSAGRDSIRTLSRRFVTQPMIDGDASRQEFLKLAATSRLLHVQTHCSWSGDALEHHFELPRPNRAATDPPVEVVTARDLFGVRVRPATHVNLVACQGGLTNIKLGDEVLGLVPALMYSGASSTVSTLWSIRDGDGAKFAALFFESFLEQCAEVAADKAPNRASVHFVDLARAARAAAIKMDTGEAEALYSWAGFVLHGFWKYPLASEDIDKLQGEGKQ